MKEKNYEKMILRLSLDFPGLRSREMIKVETLNMGLTSEEIHGTCPKRIRDLEMRE